MRTDERLVKEIEALWFPEGHLNADERDLFIERLTTLKPRTCLEIGFASGRSAVTTLVAARPDVLVSVDLSLDYIPGARAHAKRLMERFDNLQVIEGDSRAVLTSDFFARHFPRGIDFAFVDGDHRYAGCRADLEAVIVHLKPDGVIVVDDYRSGPPNGVRCTDVTRAVDDFVLAHGLALERWNRSGKGIAIVRRPGSSLTRWGSALGIVARRVGRGASRVGAGVRRRLASSSEGRA